jgi:gamma-glutamyltranspeptidase/glutathione hydrolase
VADAQGNLVSLTNTLGDLWGSYLTAEGTGMLLNDAMIWFNPLAGHINSIEPGKTPLSNVTTILGSRQGRGVLALGAPGGRKVITSVLQSVVNHIDFGKSLQQAVAAPRLHCEGPRLQIDSRIAESTRHELVHRGHDLDVLEESFVTSNFARPVGIAVDPDAGVFQSGVDALRMATAIGLTG